MEQGHTCKKMLQGVPAPETGHLFSSLEHPKNERMQVYRKLKALTDQPPNELIRNLRLKRAAELLKTGQFTVAEVTYKVGFQDLKYFRERFKAAFGVNPSEY